MAPARTRIVPLVVIGIGLAAGAARALPLPEHIVQQGLADDPYVQAGFLPVTLYDRWDGTSRVDPTGVLDSTAALNQALLDGRESALITYLPPGTYRVSDTLVGHQRYQLWGCADHFGRPLDGEPNIDYGTGQVMRKAPSLVGPGAGAPAVIQLADQSPGFGDSGSPKPVVYFYNDGPGYGSDEPDWWGQGDCGMNLHVRNLEIRVGHGNAGAIGLQMPSAQYSTIQDVRIDARGGFAGLRGTPQTRVVVNLEVVGGRYGVIFNHGSETMAGVSLREQDEAAILIDAYSPITVTGFAIDKAEGPAIVMDGSLIGAVNQGSQLSLLDGSIRLAGGSAPAIANGVAQGAGSSVYLRNVWFQTAGDLVVSGPTALPGTGGAWSHVAEYSYTDSRTGYAGVTSRTLVDGVFGQAPLASVAAAASPPPDLVSRHGRGRLPWFTDPGVKNVKDADVGARGDGVTDDRAALQQALDTFEAVFLPRGDYLVRGTLELRAGTRLIGVPGGKSRLLAHGWSPGQNAPMLRTVDDAAAATLVTDLWLLPPAGYEPSFISAVEWRAGRHSVVNELYYELPWETDTATHPRQMVHVRGHGGGRWYAPQLGQQYAGRTADPAWRALLVEGTHEPLTLYAMNGEYANAPMTEIRGAANVRILGNKTEVRHPYLLLTDATNVLHTGVAGHCQIDFGVPCQGELTVIVVDGGDDLVLANETLYASSHQAGVMLQEIGTGLGIAGTENCSLYRRGAFDETAFPACGDGVCDPWNESPSSCGADCAGCAECDGGVVLDGGASEGGGATGGDGGGSAGDGGGSRDGGDAGAAAGSLGGGCGCRARPPGGPWAAVPPLLWLLAARRRASSAASRRRRDGRTG